MQIFFKWDTDNKSRTIVVEPGDTIGQLKEKVADKIELEFGYRVPTDNDMRLRHGGKWLNNDAITVGEQGIEKETTLMLHINMGNPFPATYDEVVKPILAQDLTHLGQVQTAQFVFIGLGSYDNGHPEGEASIKRQQCPDALLRICGEKNWKLRVLLVDKPFITAPSSGSQQIYNVDANWERQANQDVDGGKVRRFQYRGHDFQLCTYATNVFKAEYDGVVKTLAGVDLSQFAQEVVRHGGCIVVGNFYKSTARPHLALGDITVLQELGYV